jgi:hypothetical protein
MTKAPNKKEINQILNKVYTQAEMRKEFHI